MTTPTPADFAAARFAEHPDGEFAVRCGPSKIDPWIVCGAPGPRRWETDEEMAYQGWRIVTPALDPSDPDVIERAAQRARDAYLGDREALPEFTWDVYRDIARAVLNLPPARDPEAEKLEAAIRDLPGMKGLNVAMIADDLASRGVRVGGGEG